MTRWTGVRWNELTGWELRCEMCAAAKQAAWWPLTHEFWQPEKGLTRCRACWNAYQRAWAADQKRAIALLPPRLVADRQEARRTYGREWARRHRRQLREDEGRARYERRERAA